MKKTVFLMTLVVISIFGVSFTVTAGDSVNGSSEVGKTLNIDKVFTGLQTFSGIEITYTQDNKASKAVINGPAEIVSKMTWEVNSKGVLSFSLPKNHNGFKGKITIKLNGQMLKNYEATSGGIINVTTPVKGGETLNFAVSSSGNIILNKEVEVTKNDINIAGSSSGEIVFLSSVRSESMNIALSSSSTMKVPVMINASTRFAASSTGILELGNVIIQNFDVALASGGECNVKEGKIQNLNVACASGGEFIGRDMKINEMALSASSGGTATLKGVCAEASLAVASGGDINVSGMKIAKVKSQKASSGGSINF